MHLQATQNFKIQKPKLRLSDFLHQFPLLHNMMGKLQNKPGPTYKCIGWHSVLAFRDTKSTSPLKKPKHMNPCLH